MTIPIKQLKIHKLNMRLKDPFTTSFGTFQDKEFLLQSSLMKTEIAGMGSLLHFQVLGTVKKR